MTLRTSLLAIALASSALGLGSCGLIDSDIADFDLSLPEKELVVDTAQFELSSDSTMPAIDCSDDPGVCSAGVSQVCGAEGQCFSTCSEADTCDLKILVSLWHSFDLATEKPELQEIEGQPLVSVSIKDIAYTVSENTMNVDTPEFVVYAAPEAVMSSGTPQALEIGRVPVIPAGQTVERGEIELSPEGRERLAEFMKNYTAPFNIIIAAEIDLEAGDTMPQGILRTTVLVSAVAGL